VLIDFGSDKGGVSSIITGTGGHDLILAGLCITAWGEFVITIDWETNYKISHTK